MYGHAKKSLNDIILDQIIHIFSQKYIYQEAYKQSSPFHYRWTWFPCYFKNHKVGTPFWIRHDYTRFAYIACTMTLRSISKRQKMSQFSELITQNWTRSH